MEALLSLVGLGQQKTAGAAGGWSGLRRVLQLRTLIQPPGLGKLQKYARKNGARRMGAL
jgi:hypothetical protein